MILFEKHRHYQYIDLIDLDQRYRKYFLFTSSVMKNSIRNSAAKECKRHECCNSLRNILFSIYRIVTVFSLIFYAILIMKTRLWILGGQRGSINEVRFGVPEDHLDSLDHF